MFLQQNLDQTLGHPIAILTSFFLLRRLSVLEEEQLILRDQQACILWGDGSVRVILIR